MDGKSVNNPISRPIEMSYIKKLLKIIIIVLLATGLISVGIFTIWVVLMTSIVVSAVFFFSSRNKWIQQS
jgi:hypothetical protein